MEKKIGVCIYRYGLGNSPSLINMGEELARAGYDVDYFVYDAFVGSVHAGNKKIKIYRLDKKNGEPNGTWLREISTVLAWAKKHAGKFVLEYKRAGLIKRIFQSVVDRMLEDEVGKVIGMVKDVIDGNSYSCFVGVEPGGLMMARELAFWKETRYAYYNMELGMFDEDRETLDLKFFAKHEKEYGKGAAFAIIQDSERARILSERTGIAMESIYIVPVSATGRPYRERSDWLRKRLGIARANKIILYAGYLAEWAMCSDMARAARDWPSDWTLVLHSNGGIEKEYLEEIERSRGENVLISLEPVPYEKLAEVLSSADIGIALYKDLGKNFTLIGSASGKVAHYLKSGLPVITNTYPSIKNIVEAYGCGECIDSPGDMKAAIGRILRNYDVMREKAFACYEDRYEFTKHFANVVTAFDKTCYSRKENNV